MLDQRTADPTCYPTPSVEQAARSGCKGPSLPKAATPQDLARRLGLGADSPQALLLLHALYELLYRDDPKRFDAENWHLQQIAVTNETSTTLDTVIGHDAKCDATLINQSGQTLWVRKAPSGDKLPLVDGAQVTFANVRLSTIEVGNDSGTTISKDNAGTPTNVLNLWLEGPWREPPTPC